MQYFFSSYEPFLYMTANAVCLYVIHQAGNVHNLLSFFTEQKQFLVIMVVGMANKTGLSYGVQEFNLFMSYWLMTIKTPGVLLPDMFLVHQFHVIRT